MQIDRQTTATKNVLLTIFFEHRIYSSDRLPLHRDVGFMTESAEPTLATQGREGSCFKACDRELFEHLPGSEVLCNGSDGKRPQNPMRQMLGRVRSIVCKAKRRPLTIRSSSRLPRPTLTIRARRACLSLATWGRVMLGMTH